MRVGGRGRASAAPQDAAERDCLDPTRTRSAVCACGTPYIQFPLTPRWLALVESAGEGAVRALMRLVPELWVPCGCGPCEVKAIAFLAREANRSGAPYVVWKVQPPPLVLVPSLPSVAASTEGAAVGPTSPEAGAA